MRDAYSDVVDMLTEFGYQGYYKDHPNPDSRLCLADSRLISIDPLIPFELLDLKFDFAFGFATTSLLSYGSNAISLSMLVKCDRAKLVHRLSHLHALDSSNLMRYPVSLTEIKQIILDHR